MWIENALGPNDVIYHDGHVYVPFAPLPAVLLMPLVAVIGPVTADQWESGINAGLAATVVLLAWWTAGRIGVERIRDRVALVLLLGFSTQIWWVTTRGGVWHTGHLVAMGIARRGEAAWRGWTLNPVRRADWRGRGYWANLQ